MAGTRASGPSASVPSRGTQASRLPLRSPARLRTCFLAAALLAASFLVYAPALRGGFIWDDDAHVSENANLRSVDGLRRIWLEPRSLPQYYPLVHTSFWLEYRLWGLATPGYHAVNVVLHTATAALAGLVTQRLGLPGAALVAIVFALHPVHVESVAWITERKNVLSGLFYLAALLGYVRFRPLGAAAPGAGAAWRRYGLAVGLFFCALLSKTVTCTLPAAILLAVWWKHGRITRGDVVPLLPLFAAGAAAGLTTAWLERTHVGAEGAEFALGPAERLLIAGRAFWFYLGKLVWPEPLAFVYPRWHVDAHAPWQYLFPLGAAAAFGLLWAARRRFGRGPLAAALFFGGTLFPALGFINIFPMRYSFVADHFQYLASLGPIVLVVAAWSSVAGGRKGVSKAAWTAATACIVLVLGLTSWRQAHIYRDLHALWHDTLSKNPDAWMAHVNLGTVYTRAGKLEQAVRSYLQALRLNPTEPSAHYDLGNTLVRQGKLEAALPRYAEAVRLRPWFVEAHYNQGLVLFQLRRFQEALPPLRRAIALDPGSAKMHHSLAQALASVGQTADALQEYRSAAALDPAWSPPRNDLAWLLATHRDASIRDGRAAVRLAQEAIATHGNSDPNYLDTLAAAYAEAGEFDLAVRTQQEAIRRARGSGLDALAGQLEVRLGEYRQRRPHREH